MIQEVEITLRGEFDARLGKAEVNKLIQDVLTDAFEDSLKIESIREEAEIYGNI